MPPQGLPAYRVPFVSSNYMIASGHYLAALAGLRILEQGGNATDAGVASGIAINVTLPHRTSIAGVAPILVYQAATNEVVSISGLGRWPKAVTLEGFNKKYGGEMPLGVPRSVIPAACDAWLTALEHYGTMTFEQVVAPSIDLAENGFPISHRVSEGIKSRKEYILDECPTTAEIYMPNGRTLEPGDILVQKDLARVFRQMADVERANVHKGRKEAIHAARDYFYKGDVAEKMVRFSEENDGYLTMQDFADFRVTLDKPEEGSYKEYTVYSCGAWCQGPSLLEILQLLEGYDLKAMGHNSAEYIHTIVEAVKLAFADRHNYFGDPDFVEVPMAGLLSKGYAAVRREALDPKKAWPEMPPPGDPWPYEGKSRTVTRVPAIPLDGPGELDTSYIAVVDRWGNAFSATPSDSITSTPIVPGLGMIISPRGTQSWLEAEYPCSVGPWRRPRLTPNPSMVFKNGHLFMPFGTPGGDTQVQAMAQMLLNIVEFGMDPQNALEEPRASSESAPNSFWPHAYYPGKLNLEGRISREAGQKLEKLGHNVNWWPDWSQGAGGMCGIVVDRERGILLGGADPRREGFAAGW